MQTAHVDAEGSVKERFRGKKTLESKEKTNWAKNLWEVALKAVVNSGAAQKDALETGLTRVEGLVRYERGKIFLIDKRYNRCLQRGARNGESLHGGERAGAAKGKKEIRRETEGDSGRE
jgi:hypothetical protein